MKKLLLASTALVMTAGIAAAEVTLSGNARMGIAYDSGNAEELSFTSRSRVIFTMSGETDGGLAFGASFRADQAGAANGDDMTGGSVFVSGEFGRLTMGDVDGAAEFIVGDLNQTSLTGLDDLHENAFLSNGDDLLTTPGEELPRRTAARYQYELDGLSLAISADQISSLNNVYSIGVGYTFDGFGVGIGYEDMSGAGNHIIGYASAEFQGVAVKATYGRIDGAQQAFLGTAGDDQYGLSVGGTFDAVTVNAFVRRDFDEDTNYGLGASYNLGGGASFVGGVQRNGGNSTTVADLGLSFSF